MRRSWGLFGLAAVCAFCVLFTTGAALAAIDIPEKLKDIPLYEGSKIQHVMDMDATAMLIASVKATPDQVADFYRNTMKQQGWKVAFQAEQESAKVIHFKKENRIFQVTVQTGKDGSDTTYNLVISAQ